MTGEVALRDGREMLVRVATSDDANAIAAEHPLPRDGDAPERLYRNYYLVKALIYARAPEAGVTTGWVGDELAGFIFHCANLEAVGRFTKSPRTLAWLAGEACRGRFGCNPRLWLDLLRWGAQHFRQPGEREKADDEDIPEISAWVGTVHTVPEFRRLGVATELLASTEQRLAASGAEEVALWVAVGNTGAQTLYEKLGYATAGEYARVGEDCALMVKRLTQITDGSTRTPPPLGAS